ncbi:type IV pilus modification protein PilV [uncultured Methylibium sp.]|uniref:type IV pilus modification protein PilV n=1 Tax=uncultured Methylibium sp. TaxID=381093 RepID=UPI0025DA850D|nr:type IV pilus modification protein PilV [uncultured Methylibium sp.]
MTNNRPPRRGHRPSQRGATMLEVLVSILIFSFGILGLVGMQARATQFSIDAEDRNRAALFADDLAAQMRLARTVSLGSTQTTAWTQRVQGLDPATSAPTGNGLPNATVTITPDVTTNTATIQIQWRHPSQAVGNESRLSVDVILTNEEVS